MIRIPRAAVMILLAIGLLLATGCSRAEGSVSPAGPAPQTLSMSTKGAPARSPQPAVSKTSPRPAARSPQPAVSKTSPQPATVSPVCPSVAATDIRGIVSCLKTSVSTFWSGELNQVVDPDVIVNPAVLQVPAACRGGLTTTPAFTCRINDTVYLNQSLLDEVTHDFGANDILYALASVVSHEIGHVVQAAVRQPGYDKTGTSPTISQQIEQQADCLSGVWALSQVKLRRLDINVFKTVSKQLITNVSSNPEIYTHGTPDQRAAAIAQGLSTGTPQSCKLNTFS